MGTLIQLGKHKSVMASGQRPRLLPGQDLGETLDLVVPGLGSFMSTIWTAFHFHFTMP